MSIGKSALALMSPVKGRENAASASPTIESVVSFQAAYSLQMWKRHMTALSLNLSRFMPNRKLLKHH
jgi:hypothetical protein